MGALLVHAPVILTLLASAFAYRSGLGGQFIFLAVVFMALAPELPKFGIHSQLGFSGIDLLHLSLGAGLLCLSVAMSDVASFHVPSPPSSSSSSGRGGRVGGSGEG